MADGCLIPNSFQVPNAYVDRLLPLLDGEEVKVVLYLARRTFGFQRKRARVSLAQFSAGWKAADGRRLDGGTGLGREAVVRALRGLQDLGVVAQTARNDAGNRGAEWALELDEERVDWAALEARRAERTAAGKARTEKARTARGRSVGRTGAGGTDGGGSVAQTARSLFDGEAGSLPDGAAGGVSDGRMETQGKPRRNPGGGGSEDECAEARRRLMEVGIRNEGLLDYLSTPRLAEWAVRWAAWWPAVAGRIGEGRKRAFLTARIEGAAAGKAEDREPPREWWDYQAARETAARREAALEAQRHRRRAEAEATATVVAPESEGLWRELLGLVGEVDGAVLSAAKRVEERPGRLVVVFGTQTGLQVFLRRRAGIAAAAEQGRPGFPAVCGALEGGQ